MQRGAFELTELQERADTLRTREQALQLEVASLSSPDHVATKAARLGMVPNASPAFLRLSSGKVIGRPSPALPGTNLPGLARTDAQRRDGDRNGGQDRNRQQDRNRRQNGSDRQNGNGQPNRDGQDRPNNSGGER